MTEHARIGSLAPAVVRGLGWKTVSQLVDFGVRTAVAVLLARLLGPHELGLAAMALAFSALGRLFADGAMDSAMVQRRALSGDDLATALWTSIAAGALMTVIGVASSGAVAAFFGEPRVQRLFALLSLTFVLEAAATVPTALLSRNLDFRRLELCGVATSVVSGAVAVGFAFAGAGAGSVVAQRLAAAVFGLAVLWLTCRWRPRLAFSRRSLGELGGFSLHVVGSRFFFYMQRNADNLLVGRYLGAAALGSYALAYNLMLLPFFRVVDPIRHVLFPALSRVQDDTVRVARLWLRSTRVIAAVLLPALTGLAVVAPDFVSVVLGNEWSDAVWPIRLLAVVGLAQSLIAVDSVVLMVFGRTRALLRFSVITFVLSLAGFAVGLLGGITGVAAGYLAATLLIVPAYLRLTADTVQVPLRRFAASLAGVARITAAMLVVVVGLRAALVALAVPADSRLVAVTVAGVAVVLGLAARDDELRAELGVLRAVLASRRGAVTPTAS